MARGSFIRLEERLFLESEIREARSGGQAKKGSEVTDT